MEKDFTMNIVLPIDYSSCLESEMKLLRSSMMYADKIILNSSEVNSIAKAYNKYGEDYKEMFIGDRKDIIDALKEGINKNPGKTVTIKGVEISGDELFGAYIREMEKGIDEIDRKDRNFKKILPYILSGDIKLQQYDLVPDTNEDGEVEVEPGRQEELYIASLLTDAVDYEYYTLFDEGLFEVVDEKVREITSLQNANKYRHAGFVHQVIPAMPNFEKAELDEIIDIKRELAKPLERFRRKVYTFSNEIAALPWEKSFAEECRYIYQVTMKESLDEIEELSKASSIVKNIAANFSQMNVLELAGGITASVLAGEYWAVMASLLTAAKVSKEALDYYERAKQAKKNHMYFYYEASRKFEKLKR